jgi:hypothetical protein
LTRPRSRAGERSFIGICGPNIPSLLAGYGGLFLSGEDGRQPYQCAEDTHHAGHPHYDALKACSFFSTDISP